MVMKMLRIKELRKRDKMSQQVLADKLGVSRSTVAMWEKGTEPGSEMLQSISALFHVSVDYLLGGKNVLETSNTHNDVSKEERKLLNIYRKLNDDGMKALRDYADYLSSKDEYKRSLSHKSAI